MDIRKLHEKYKDQDSPSVELQVRWLRRLGFESHQIDQAILTVYTEIEKGEKDFKSGAQLNAYLRDMASKIRTEEISAYIAHLEQFEAKLKAKWEAERIARDAAKLAIEGNLSGEQLKKELWYKRLFGK